MSLPKNASRFDSRDDLELGLQTSTRPSSQRSLIPPPRPLLTDGVDESSRTETTSAHSPSERPKIATLDRKDRATRRRVLKTLSTILYIAFLVAVLALNMVCGIELTKMTKAPWPANEVKAACWISVYFCCLFLPLTPVVYAGAKSVNPEASTRQRIVLRIVALLYLAVAVYLPFGYLYDRLVHY